MKRPLLALALIASATSLSAGPQAPVERSAGHLVIDAVALDRHNMPVMDLKPGDVEVWIGHYQIPVESLAAITPDTDDGKGRLVVLVLDDVTVPPSLVPRVKDAARAFVNRLGPDDRMAIVRLNGSGMATTSERGPLLGAISLYNVLAFNIQRPDELGRHVLETIGTLARQMAEGPEQRKTIVGIGSGWLFDKPIPAPFVGGDLRPEWIEAMRATAFANVNVYAIDPRGIGASRADSGVSGFARETGGLAFLNVNDLDGAADRIMRESANYYLISVADPPVGSGAPLRELDVRAHRPGVTIRARHAVKGGQ